MLMLQAWLTRWFLSGLVHCGSIHLAFVCHQRVSRRRYDVSFIHPISNSGFIQRNTPMQRLIAAVHVYRSVMCMARDTRSTCREWDSLGIRFRKEGRTHRDCSHRGESLSLSLFLFLPLVRTSAKQMSHRSRSTDAHRRARENCFSRLR